MPSELFYYNTLDRSISNSRGLVSFHYIFTEIPELNANNVDPDQTPQNAASDV